MILSKTSSACLRKDIGYTGLLFLMYPRPVMVVSAVLDFFPIEGARKTFREARDLYQRLEHGDRIAMAEGYHGSSIFRRKSRKGDSTFSTISMRIAPGTPLCTPKEIADKDLLCTKSPARSCSISPMPAR